MAKIMLVEDDNNLREIYEARLLAEGYEIVSAKDGEEALAMAVKEKPDLIISDVMMPKISGFDMLDILRSTPETKNTKVIMMTALSQAEDKARAEKLGADRYLVKSQVTLEDVAKVTREVLSGDEEGQGTAYKPAGLGPVVTQASDPTAVSPPVEPPASSIPPANEPEEPPTPPTPTPLPASPTPPPPTAPPDDDTAAPSIAGGGSTAIDPKLAESIEAEEAAVHTQIDNFVATAKDPEPVEQAPIAAPAASAPVTDEDTGPQLEVKEPPIQMNPNQAAGVADKLTSAVNDLLAEKTDQPTSAAPATTAPVIERSSHERVLQPINDPSKKTDINALYEKEIDQQPAPRPPASSVVSPGGQTVTPANPGDAPDPTKPGNIIQGGSDPNSIAL